VIKVILPICRSWKYIVAAEAYLQSCLTLTLDWDEGSSSHQSRFSLLINTQWEVENIKIITGKYVYDAPVDSSVLHAAWPVFTSDSFQGPIQLRVKWVQSALPPGSSFRSARWQRTSTNASKRMCRVLFSLFHTSLWHCVWATGLVYVPKKRISPLFTWGTDDSCYIFPFPRAWCLPHFIVEAVRQVTFVALTLHAAQHHGVRVATEKICLYGVIGIAQSQLPADYHSFEYTPAVPAHQTPSCNSSNRFNLLWSGEAFTKPSTVITNSNLFGTGNVFEMHSLTIQ
jgi:hypothetical protein